MAKKCSEVLVRWKTNGAFGRHGVAYAREKGDEDLMEVKEAKALAITGHVEIIENGRRNKRIDGEIILEDQQHS